MAHFRIDNVIPLGARANWLTGAGATRAELALVYGTSLAGTAIIWLLFVRTQPWAVWQVVIALAITADLIGGAVANALSSTKRRYQNPEPAGWSWLPPILMAKLLFADAVHEEPYRP